MLDPALAADPASGVSATSWLLSQGVLGIVTLALAWWARDRDQLFRAEAAARHADAKEFRTLALELQRQVADQVNKLSDVMDEILRSRGGR